MFTMEALAQSVCQQLLSQLKLSNLNYVVTETPYSAQINIRKRFIKELSEANPAFVSDMSVKKLTEENMTLQAEIECVKTAKNVEKDKVEALEGKIHDIEVEASKAHEKAKDENSTLKSIIKKLNTELDHHKSDLNQISKNLKHKEKEVKKFEVKAENLENTVKEVRHENKILKADTKRLEKSLKLVNDHGRNATQGSVSGKYKLEKQKNVNDSNQNILLVHSNSTDSIPPSPPPPGSSSSPPVTPARAPATTSSPLATPARLQPISSSPWSPLAPRTLPPSPHTPPGIPPTNSSTSDKEPLTNSVLSSNFSESQPNFSIPVSKTTHTNKFSRNFLFSSPNTEFHVCNHSTQCIIREPLPPPFPSITFLHNEKSEYHTHMMQWSKKEFAGCVKCFSIENENYGCRDCRWLKFWYARHGETHGFPDIATWIYKKYL